MASDLVTAASLCFGGFESTGTGGGTFTEFPVVGSELLALLGAISLIVWTFHER
jgi:hypothetical protein